MNQLFCIRFWGRNLIFMKIVPANQSENGSYLKQLNFAIHKIDQLLISSAINYSSQVGLMDFSS